MLLQRTELAALRAEQQRLAVVPRAPSQAAPEATAPALPAETGIMGDVSSEVLRLRAEVTRLSARKRELAAAPETLERLRAQLASSMTNTSAGVRLPPGYIRKTQARMVGYDTPDNTIESFLWALANRDLEKLAQALTPQGAESLRMKLQRAGSTESFFKESELFPGWAIKGREQLPDGTLELQMEIVPGVPPQGKLRMQQVNGQWKISEPL